MFRNAWPLLIGVAGGQKILLRLPLAISDNSVLTQGLAVDGIPMNMVVNLNYPDLIVPICRGSPVCLDPTVSSNFNYCDVPTMCMDRQSPSFQCSKLKSGKDWSLEKSLLSPHVIETQGSQMKVSTFEFIDSLTVGETTMERVPMKGAGTVASAMLGLGPQRMSCRNETFVTSIGAHYFGLSGSELIFYDKSPSDGMWTEQFQLGGVNTSIALGKYAFNMYQPTVCGVDLLGNTSSHWTALVDSTRECLVLPAVLYERLAVWKSGSDKSLYFYLNDQRDAQTGASLVALDLNSVCVQSQPKPASDAHVAVSARWPIILGYSAVMSMKGDMGFEAIQPFRTRFSSTSKLDDRCTVVRAVCIGQQVYHQPSNTCINPACEEYLYSELDAEAGTCRWKQYVPVLVYTGIVVLVFGELLVHRLNKKINALAQSACEGTD